jgi:Cu-Zn family superoxide dismutase
MLTKPEWIAIVYALASVSIAHARQGERTVATARIESKSGSKLKGKAVFTADKAGAVTMHLEVSDAPPGELAVHVHDKGDCSSPDAKSAGDHWNPMHREHGKNGAETGLYHLGDIGNIQVGADGKGALTVDTKKWTALAGEFNDVIGHSIVVHAGTDDFKTQPSGNSGARIGCGVITK